MGRIERIYHLAEAIGIAYDADEGRSVVKRRLGALAMTLGLIVVGAIAIGALSLAARLDRSHAAVRWVAVGHPRCRLRAHRLDRHLARVPCRRGELQFVRQDLRLACRGRRDAEMADPVGGRA